MKILHLSTHDMHGGAARAAWRLHQGLRQLGANSKLLVRTQRQDSESVAATDDGTLAAWHEQIATPWLQKRLPAGASWFTVGCLDAFVENHHWVRDADVLHLHWVAEWLSAEAIARLAAKGKPIFWTMHDLWPVTGGSHYAGSNNPEGDVWQTGETMPKELRDIAAREFARKFQLIRELPLHVISPSRWLADVVRSSRVGSGWKIDVLPNGIDTEVFRPAERGTARARWNLPADKVILLFGCQALKERRKGFPELCEALKLAARDAAFAAMVREAKVELAIFGGDKIALDDLPLPARHLGVIADEKEMASLYQAADAFLCPALEDNLPTTVIESLACGLPVLGFATGGVPDFVRDGENGLLAPCPDVTALAARIVRFATDEALRRNLQAAARRIDPALFSVQTQARCAVEYYKAVMASANPVPVPVVSNESSPSTFTMISSESAWLLNAAAESSSAACQRETALRQKLDQTKDMLASMKTKVPATPLMAKKKSRWFHRWLRP